jgi:glycosyltransferase involved in cell wall biosynthesis
MMVQTQPLEQRKGPNPGPEVSRGTSRRVEVALLTGGADKDYAFGLTAALVAEGVFVDFIGSDEVNGSDLHLDRVRSFNLRGNQKRSAGAAAKLFRVLKYYFKLLGYAAQAKPKIFHILWNNKFQFFDRTLLMLYYKALGKRIAFTAHNVNAGKRDLNDSFANRFSLHSQYRLADNIFVHTEKMKQEMMAEFGVPGAKITVIPYGLYNSLPLTGLTTGQARQKLGLDPGDKVMLFFGNLAPYKGLAYLVQAFSQLLKKDPSYRLVIAGPTNNCQEYWGEMKQTIAQSGAGERIISHIGFVPEEQVELYFKAADVCVLPYTHIFQSGVLFLSYSFGLPVIASDVGSLSEEILPGKTGFIFPPQDVPALAIAIETYFSSDLFNHLPARREFIKQYAEEGHAWSKVGAITSRVYSSLLQ